MTDSVFDIALQKRFDEAPLIAAIEVTSNDTLLIRDLETGQIMRIPVSILYSALGSAFASLVDGKVPASQLPSYVDDVLEYANLAAFPGTGESGKIYVALDTNKVYRWSGSTYIEISSSLALGETSSTAYRGDRGKTAYDHSQTTGNPHGVTKSDVGLSNVDNTADSAKSVNYAATAGDITASEWDSYTPAVTSSSGTFSNISVEAKFKRIGKTTFIKIAVTVIAAGSASGTIIATLPVDAKESNKEVLTGRETDATGKMCMGIVIPHYVYIVDYLGASIIATGNRVVVCGSYEGV
jgi:hypothetical protein